MLSELRRRHLASAHARTRGTSAFGPFLIGSLLLGSSLLVSLDIGSARADCDTADGRVKWLSGIVYTYYEPGEGLNGAVLGAASNGNYLVMPTDVFGARSFEITGPGELDQRSSLSVGYTEDIMADGSLFYLAAPPGLRIISINAQGVLASVGSMSTAYSYGLDKQGDYVYLATGSGLEVIDVSTPSAPAVVGTWNGSIRHVAVAGSRAYVATTSDGVYSIDISVATNPTFVARVITPVVSDVEADAGYLYTSSSNNGFRIYDLTQPDAPAQVGQLSENAQRLVLADGYALLDQSGTKLVDVTDPTQPVLTGAYRGAGFLGATVVDGVAYLAGGLGGLQAVDLGDHTNPAPLTTFPSGASGKDLTTFGSHLAMLQGDLFQIVSLADPINPVNEGSLSMPGVNGFGISGDYAFAVYQGQFHTIDLSNPSSPQVVATIAAPVAVYDLVVTGDRIYYWNDAGISTIVNTIDISDPLAPVLLASEELFFPTAVMAAQGTRSSSAKRSSSITRTSGSTTSPTRRIPWSRTSGSVSRSPR
ncbi:MAG: hypothetical protein R3E12_00350 [Candidatus Eisenbacteria bacterium]